MIIALSFFAVAFSPSQRLLAKERAATIGARHTQRSIRSEAANPPPTFCAEPFSFGSIKTIEASAVIAPRPTPCRTRPSVRARQDLL